MNIETLHLHWTIRKHEGKAYRYYSLARSFRSGKKVRKEIVVKIGTLTNEEVVQCKNWLISMKGIAKNPESVENLTSSKQEQPVKDPAFLVSGEKRNQFPYDSIDQEADLALAREFFQTEFSQIADPRTQDNLKYPFYGILIIILAAMLASAKSISAIREYAQAKKHLFAPLLGTSQMPSYMAFWWTLNRSNPAELNQAFLKWLQSAADALTVQNNTIAIDGKTLRGAKGSPLHYVSAYDNTRGLLLGQVKTREKSNEITAIPELLKVIDVQGSLVTIDAMGCQKDICTAIRERGGHYCLALKGNHGNLHAEAVNFFKQARAVEYEEVPCLRDTQHDKGHGRLETREVTITTDLSWLDCKDDWKDLEALVEVRSIRTIKSKKTEECRYYITSKKMSAKEASASIRSHWSVESFHWVLDVLFSDDLLSPNRGYTAENLGLFRRIAYFLLKQDTVKGKGLASKQRKAMWDDGYVMEILIRMIRQANQDLPVSLPKS